MLFSLMGFCLQASKQACQQDEWGNRKIPEIDKIKMNENGEKQSTINTERGEFLLKCHKKAFVHYSSVVWCIHDVILKFAIQFTIVFPWLYKIWQSLLGGKLDKHFFICIYCSSHTSHNRTLFTVFSLPSHMYECEANIFMYISSNNEVFVGWKNYFNVKTRR